MRNKCEATGKVIFSTLKEAQDCILDILFYWKLLKQGKRTKHRQGKPAQKRVYACEFCGGYHLTKWETYRKKPNSVPITILRTLILSSAFRKKVERNALQPQAG